MAPVYETKVFELRQNVSSTIGVSRSTHWPILNHDILHSRNERFFLTVNILLIYVYID